MSSLSQSKRVLLFFFSRSKNLPNNKITHSPSNTLDTYLNQWAFMVAPRSDAHFMSASDNALDVALSQGSPAWTEAWKESYTAGATAAFKAWSSNLLPFKLDNMVDIERAPPAVDWRWVDRAS